MKYYCFSGGGISQEPARHLGQYFFFNTEPASDIAKANKMNKTPITGLDGMRIKTLNAAIGIPLQRRTAPSVCFVSDVIRVFDHPKLSLIDPC